MGTADGSYRTLATSLHCWVQGGMGWEGLFFRNMQPCLLFVWFHFISAQRMSFWQGCYVCIVTGYCEGGDMWVCCLKAAFLLAILLLFYLIIMFIFDRAELMKKANGTYFPEEVAIIFCPPFIAHWVFFLEIFAYCCEYPIETAEMVCSIGISCWLSAFKLCFTSRSQGKRPRIVMLSVYQAGF